MSVPQAVRLNLRLLQKRPMGKDPSSLADWDWVRGSRGGRARALTRRQARARQERSGARLVPAPHRTLYFFADTSFPLPYLRPLGSFSPPTNSPQQPQRETAPAAATGPLLTIPAACPTVRRGGGARMPLTLGPAPAPRPPPSLAEKGRARPVLGPEFSHSRSDPSLRL